MAKINQHGEKDFDPTRYEFAGWFDLTPFMGFAMPGSLQWAMEERNFHVDMLVKHSNSVYGKVGQCAHCGTAIRYHCVYNDTLTGAIIAIGETCAHERFGRSKSEWAAKKAKLDASREKALAGEKFIAIRETYPVAGQLMADCLADRERLGYGDEFADLYPDFVLDISQRALRYGSVSDKQAAAVEKWVPLHREKVATRAADKVVEEANARPVVEGKGIAVEGEILVIKYQDGYAYGALDCKMLVRLDGYKLWGTCPRNIEEAVLDVDDSTLIGKTVRFVANVEVSRDDASFGFFKRPRKAELVAEGVAA